MLVRQAEQFGGRRAGSFAFGTNVAALTHFSAISWRSVSSVVVIRRPPSSSAVAGRDVLAAELGRRAPSGRPRRSAARPSRGVCCGARTTFSSFAAAEVGGIVLAARQRVAVALGQQVEDLVPALDDLGVLGDDERRRCRGRSPSSATGTSHSSIGVQDEVVVGRRLRQPGEDRRLGDRQVLELLAEVRLRRRLDRRSSGCRSSSG